MRSKSPKSTFIIGAGAHVPYGFPTGLGLKEIIRQMAFLSRGEEREIVSSDALNNIIAVILKNIEIFSNHYKDFWNKNSRVNASSLASMLVRDFVTDFLDSSSNTIDSFLAERTEWSLLGKVIIAVIIREFEKQDPLRSRNSDWIQVFINKYVNEREQDKLVSNFPNVITFNYDRLLEEAIARRLSSFLRYDEDAVESILNSLPIFHVYGKKGVNRFDEFKGNPLKDILQASLQIKVIGEERKPESLRLEIEKYIEPGCTVYFLGFGFDSINCELVLNEMPFKEAFATNVKLHDKLKR